MGVVVTGGGIGFFAAVFVTMYANGLFHQQIPVIVIYGIVGPFIAAVSIFVMILLDKKEREKAERDIWSIKKEEERFGRRD